MKNIVLVSVMVLLFSGVASANEKLKKVEPVFMVPVAEVKENRDYFNIALKAGTLGMGIDLSTVMSKNITARLNVNRLNFNHTEVIDDIKYDGNLESFTAGILLDYFLSESYPFRLSGGVYYNGNKFRGTAKPMSTMHIEINGMSYGVDDIGKLDTDITFDKVAPYLGIGWGSDMKMEGWGFSLDAGALYHGTPKADLDVTINNAMLETQIRNDVAIEKERILDDIEKYKFYPVIMVGLNYTF